MNNIAYQARNGNSSFPNAGIQFKPTPNSNAITPITGPIAGLSRFEQVFVPHGTTVVTQGAQMDFVFYILSGWALEEELTCEGDVAWADVMMRGEVAGLNCVMHERDRRGHHHIATASIQAITDVFAVRVPRFKIASYLDADRAFSKLVSDTLRRQSAHLHDHLVALSAKSAHERVLMLLRALHERAVTSNALKLSQRLPISQVILARIANVSVVHMNRIAQKLRLDGFLDWTSEGVLLRVK